MPPSARPAPLAAEDDERAHLLAGPAGLLERKPTAVELRLAVLAFGWLCVAAIGFGLFAGELARSHPAHPSPPSTILTTTVFVAPTGLPSPPKKPSQTIGIDGLPEAFHALFPAGQVSQRIQAATKLADTLARLAALPGETQVLELDQAQRLACPATAPWPCWIRWKDFFAALHPDKPIRRLTLHGVDYFAHMARTIAEQSEIGLESFFHWVLIHSMRRHDCRQETKLVFGPSLLTLLFLNTSEQRTALQAHQRATRFVLAAMRDRAPRENWPRTLEGPPTDTDQSQELAAVSPDSWVETVYALERIRTRRAFAEGRLRWDVLASRPAIAGDVLYLPLGALQMPQSFPFSTDLPKSLLFGSTGYVLLDARDQAIGAHPAGERSGCEARLATAFAGWAAWAAAHPRQSRGRLVGLPAHIGAPDALFFVAFGRLGIGCPAIRRLPPFVAAFNCSTPTSL
ncbi:hypothetical protein PtB15_14B429 [Puccinia triticina]|nr:hypothetical protein PtB15_14B429 [Puccinia triticina]